MIIGDILCSRVETVFGATDEEINY